MKSINLIFCVVFTTSFAQPVVEWQNTIGGTDGDYLYKLVPTQDGTLLVGLSGSTISGDKTEANSYFDAWIVKLNLSGNIVWQNTIGGGNYDIAVDADETYDGGFIIGGYSNSNASGDKTENCKGETDYWIVKIDNSGNVLWDKTIGGSNDDLFRCVQETADHGFIVAGYSESNISGDKTENNYGFDDIWVVKLSESGNIEWQNTIGTSTSDYLANISQTADGGYVLGISTISGISGDKTEANHGLTDFWILKLSPTGTIEWQNTIGGNDLESISCVQPTSNNEYIVCGRSNSSISGDKTENNMGYGGDYWILKLDSIGNIIWQNTIGGPNHDFPQTIFQTASGEYFVSGISTSPAGGDKTDSAENNGDFWVLKLDILGSIIWQISFTADSSELLNSCIQHYDGGYVLGGSSISGIGIDKAEACIGMVDFWVIKLAPDESGIGIETNNNTFEVSIFPNPTSDFVSINTSSIYPIDIHIYNEFGQLLIKKNNILGITSIPLGGLAKGIYICEIRSHSGYVKREKIIYNN